MKFFPTFMSVCISVWTVYIISIEDKIEFIPFLFLMLVSAYYLAYFINEARKIK